MGHTQHFTMLASLSCCCKTVPVWHRPVFISLRIYQRFSVWNLNERIVPRVRERNMNCKVSEMIKCIQFMNNVNQIILESYTYRTQLVRTRTYASNFGNLFSLKWFLLWLRALVLCTNYFVYTASPHIFSLFSPICPLFSSFLIFLPFSLFSFSHTWTISKHIYQITLHSTEWRKLS